MYSFTHNRPHDELFLLHLIILT